MRRWMLSLLLIAAAIGAGGYAASIELDDEVAVALDDRVTVTPVLSPRRVPVFLQRPRADDRVRLGLLPVIDQSPEDACLIVEQDGHLILEYHPHRPLVPASNQKLVLGDALLSHYGAEATFRTSVVAAVEATDGRIDGDLWLVGGGDPYLSTDDFVSGFAEPPVETDLEGLADAVASAGVTVVTGDIVGDDSRYDGVDTVPSWPPRDYGTATPGPLDGLVVNRGLAVYATGPEEILVPQPSVDAPLLAADRFAALLRDRGIEVRGGTRTGAAPGDAVELAGADSAPMREMVRQMMAHSDNTAAELLLKELGLDLEGEGSTAAGLRALESVMIGEGRTDEGVVYADGSGLHDQDRLTCALLRDVLVQAGPESDLVEALPVAGETGTLRERFVGTLVAGNLRAKTGSLNEATALSGYIRTVPGQVEVVFAYMANAPVLDDEVVELQDLLASVLSRYPEGASVFELEPRSAGTRLSAIDGPGRDADADGTPTSRGAGVDPTDASAEPTTPG